MNDTLKADLQSIADKYAIDFTVSQQVVVTSEETTQFTHNA